MPRLLSAFSAYAVLSCIAGVPLWAAAIGGVLAGLWPGWTAVEVEGAATPWLKYTPWLLGLILLPVLWFSTSPGADAAMYGGIARALLKGSPDLSTAYPGVRVAMYPKGFSALIAAFTPILGMAKASLVAAAAAYVVFAYALSLFLRRIVPRADAWAIAVALTLISRHVPLGFFAWGGNPTVLAFALALGSYFVHPLWLAGAFATHPIGAIAGLAATPLVFYVTRDWKKIALPIVLVLPLVVCFKVFGPVVSPGEAEWIARWQREQAQWASLPRQCGDVLAVVFYIALAGAVYLRWWRWVAFTAVSFLYILALMLLGPMLPVLGTFIYADRLTFLYLLMMAPVLALIARHIKHRFPGIIVVVALAVVAHLGLQPIVPLANHDDVAMAACVTAKVPAGEIIHASYGEGGQWLAALTGHAITQAHVHCSLFDEMHGARERMQSRYQYLGSNAQYLPALAALEATETLCEQGQSKLVRLKEPVGAGPDPW